MAGYYVSRHAFSLTLRLNLIKIKKYEVPSFIPGMRGSIKLTIWQWKLWSREENKLAS